MRIAFEATNASFNSDEDTDTLICGVQGMDAQGVEHYLIFQRISEEWAEDELEEDWGVHAEFDDQSNGAYNSIARCHLSPQMLLVDLSKQLGSLAGVDGFDVSLKLDDAAYRPIKEGMQRIFRDTSGVFTAD